MFVHPGSSKQIKDELPIQGLHCLPFIFIILSNTNSIEDCGVLVHALWDRGPGFSSCFDDTSMTFALGKILNKNTINFISTFRSLQQLCSPYELN